MYILTGSTSGSSDHSEIVGSLHFLETGYMDVEVSNNPAIRDIDKSMFILASEFSAYAFNRKDWMHEFLKEHEEDSSKSVKHSAQEEPSHLTLVIGGLDNNEGE